MIQPCLSVGFLLLWSTLGPPAHADGLQYMLCVIMLIMISVIMLRVYRSI